MSEQCFSCCLTHLATDAVSCSRDESLCVSYGRSGSDPRQFKLESSTTATWPLLLVTHLAARAQVAHLVRAAPGDEYSLARVLLKVPQLHALLLLQLLPVPLRQHEGLAEHRVERHYGQRAAAHHAALVREVCGVGSQEGCELLTGFAARADVPHSTGAIIAAGQK